MPRLLHHISARYLDPWNMHTFFEQNCRILREKPQELSP